MCNCSFAGVESESEDCDGITCHSFFLNSRDHWSCKLLKERTLLTLFCRWIQISSNMCFSML